MKRKLLVFSALAVLIVTVGFFTVHNHEEVDFSNDVKPILNKHCISCHGGVKKNGDLSFLFEEEAFANAKSGEPAIIRGDAEHSNLIKRLLEDDPELRMPYNAAKLDDKEIDILRKWIDQGAKWGKHWAYELPETVEVPKSFSFASLFGFKPDGISNNIDYFIQDKLDEKGLSFAEEADKETLLRRVYLDLTGVPPSLAEVNSFINDKSEDAYEKRIDSLLASEQYGEKWASWWLDMARYADTKGYEKDVSRQIWEYRDWVIKAFNKDMPYDQFTIEQLAGDLLPEPTKDQLIATAFHRNTMNNDEGGTDSEEFRVAAVLDRVNTTYQVWLSTTFECVQCHSHTYDPFKFEEYYKSVAFFNNTRDEDTEGDHPRLRFYGEADQLRVDSIKTWLSKYGNEKLLHSTDLFLKSLEPKIHAHYSDRLVNAALYDTKWLGVRNGGNARLRDIQLDGKKLIYLNYWTGNTGGKLEIHKDTIGGGIIAEIDLPNTNGRQVIQAPIAEVTGRHDLYLVFKNPNLGKDQPVCMIEWFAFREPFPNTDAPNSEHIQKSILQLVNTNPSSVPIMIENPKEMKRTTHVFERGNRLAPGEVVEPKVPETLNPFPKNAPNNRLGFAQWLVAKDNPLTARTVVNRVWAQIFGRGLVEPLGDMGTQSIPPIHRELLDYLALDLMHEKNWSIKSLIKDMVLSSTYKQSSSLKSKDAQKDPENYYLARGPRFRLSAEQIRDQALTVSGLLSNKMFGPSVMPYQPDGVWMTVYSGEAWKKSEGEDQFRRGIYTFLKRTSPYPSFISFDASSREVCLVDRIRTNTPLQALTTLNDPVYIEAAKSLASIMKKEGKGDLKSSIAAGYQHTMFRKLSEDKLVALEKLYAQALENFEKRPGEAEKFMGENHKAANRNELLTDAAFTLVANALLNLDEFLTKS
ncbi:DUF1553 domain-containing protein [Sphingobacterium cellulitidis]|uniref:DUF1553 domain-containing protein n=1 Tax=Sphingobacterium cellulitidis TaxID=1768011 RepID=A0A8H9FXB3_9SPHI|nr:DUF1553 domain-containing protein [Sphingobacterium soli]MBA8986865.1 hypothetical protein [Sphingobacterium soli]GGE14549.1 hypothetical protein GCM10011516_10440 [Sphingobacterium soli]